MLSALVKAYAPTSKYKYYLDTEIFKKELERRWKKTVPDEFVIQNFNVFSKDVGVGAIVHNILMLKREGYKRYIFAKEFFEVLQDVPTDPITWDMFPKDFYRCHAKDLFLQVGDG